MSRILPCLLFLISGGACALDFVAVGDQSAILYDAPSLKANKLLVVSPHYPLEAVVTLESWVKVRDNNGKLAWVEKALLGGTHYVMVTSPLADIRQAASDQSPLVFRAKTGVLLDVSGNPDNGWIAVHHQDGQSGYVKASQVWGG
ncbi:MAG: hypothetical protein K2P57_09400 [Burkholderiales bacterium]|nr:hypothetical protein [Burkholderiales bacterium]